MTKIPQEINNIPQDNLQALAQLFPSAVKDGQLDISALKEELGDFEEVNQEKYELTWTGKQKAKKLVQEDVINRTLNFIEEDSKHVDTTENLYIEGDNLEVLKLLRKNYYGSIKMIYIDPPYNLDGDFIYNDDFRMTSEESDIEEGTRDEEGNRLQKASKSSNRYHAKWLNLMYPRLKIAKDLLADDGVIFISIDDTEVHDLRAVCNEIFGESNFIGTIIWKKKTNGNNMGYIPPVHDYFLCFAKSASEKSILGFPLSEEEISNKYKNPDNDSRGAWKTSDLSANHEGPYFGILNPNTGKTYFPAEGRYWVFNENEVKRRIDAGRIIFGKTGKSAPVQKKFLAEKTSLRSKAESWWDSHGMNEDGTEEMGNLFVPKIFNHTKPTITLKHLINISTDEKDIILDFFSGSASTADATMQLNAEDEGNRKFILVQLDEDTSPKSIAFTNNFKSIPELAKERIRRAGEKIKAEIEEANAKLKEDEEPKKIPDIGFKVFRVADTNIKWNLEQLSPLEQAFGYEPDVIDFVQGFKDKDIVYEIMLRQHDIPLSASLETLQEIGNRTYLYGSSYLICLETEITQSMVDTLASIEPLPLKYVFRDSAFGDDINLKDETFRRLDSLIKRNAGDLKVSYTVEFI